MITQLRSHRNAPPTEWKPVYCVEGVEGGDFCVVERAVLPNININYSNLHLITD